MKTGEVPTTGTEEFGAGEAEVVASRARSTTASFRGKLQGNYLVVLLMKMGVGLDDQLDAAVLFQLFHIFGFF